MEEIVQAIPAKLETSTLPRVDPVAGCTVGNSSLILIAPVLVGVGAACGAGQKCVSSVPFYLQLPFGYEKISNSN